MCDYCGCLNHAFIAELSAEHESIAAVAGAVAAAHARDVREAGRVALGRLLDLLAPHTRREEQRLFPEVAAAGAAGHTATLEADHAALDTAFVAAAGGDEDAWAALPAALERLSAHIWREDYDLFPAALQLLDTDAWSRVHAPPGPRRVAEPV